MGSGGDIVERLRERGAVYLRVGHYLAQRPDVVADRHRAALLAMAEHAEPLPWGAVERRLARGLARPADKVFAEIQPAPLRSNAIAQTHRARLPAGDPVLVKIVRPDAREAVAAVGAGRAALENLLFEHAAPSGEAGVSDVVDDIVGWLTRQLDLLAELANVDRLRRLAVDSAWERIPLSYPDLCSTGVLVVEDVGGVFVSDVLRTSPSKRPRTPAHVAAVGIDPVRLARVIVTVNLRQIFRYRRFDADMHPANLIALPDDLISFADFAALGELDRSMAERQLSYLSGVVDGDMDRALDPPTDVVVIGEHPSMAVFRRDLLSQARDRNTVAADSGDEAVPWPSEYGELLIDVLRTARTNGVPLPPDAQLAYRSIVNAGEVARGIDDEVDAADVMKRFLGVARLDAKIRSVEPDRLQGTAISLLTLLRDAPGQVQKILADIADGVFTLNVWTSEVPSVERSRDRRSRIVVAAITSISLALLLTISDLPSVAGVSVAAVIGAALGLVYVWVLLAWWRLR